MVGESEMPASEVESVWRVGGVIADLYEVREVITSGAMGLVYRVWHRDWDIELAVKTARPELLGTPNRLRNFEIEAGRGTR